MIFKPGVCSSFCYLMCTVSLIFVVHIAARSQSLKYQAHPCHYIILVDASSSTKRENTKTNYNKAIEEVLLSHLYEKGFGESIPPFEPKQDLLTLLNFGVVIKSSTPAYQDLRHYDLSNQFIHTLIMRREGVEINELRHQVVPRNFYEITALSWAKQMALWSLRNQFSDTTNHRTFLIMVHDGDPNENSLEAEISMLERWGEPSNVEKVSELVSHINQKYQFTDGLGGNKRAWAEPVQVQEGSRPVFVEAYEIKSKAQLTWEAEAKQFKPFGHVSFGWDNESGDHPVGTLHVEMDGRFIDRLRANQSGNGQLALEHGDQRSVTPWDLDNHKSLSTAFTTELDCEQKRYAATIEAPITRKDEILGTSTLLFSYRQPVTAPLPFRCTWASSVWWWLRTLLIAVFIVAACYWAYYRFFSTHITVELPGMAIKVPVERRGQTRRETLIPPAVGLEAFSLLLPKKWVQDIFYKEAVITVQVSRNVKLELPDHVKDMIIKLPIAETRLLALWGGITNAPTEAKLTFQQGRQSFEVNLSYPGGA